MFIIQILLYFIYDQLYFDTVIFTSKNQNQKSENQKVCSKCHRTHSLVNSVNLMIFFNIHFQIFWGAMCDRWCDVNEMSSKCSNNVTNLFLMCSVSPRLFSWVKLWFCRFILCQKKLTWLIVGGGRILICVYTIIIPVNNSVSKY